MSRMSKVDLSVYFSVNEKNKEPRKENCDKSVVNPNGSITMPLLGKDRFENEEVFFSVYSITGCTVNLTASFPDLKIQNFSRKMVKEDQLDDTDFDNFLVCRKWRAHDRKRGEKKDRIISDYVEKIKDYADLKVRR